MRRRSGQSGLTSACSYPLPANVVAGYSRLMHHDEEATHGRLTYLLTEAIHPAIVEYGGRIVKNTGDGFLAEFPSAVQAVRAAAQFQTRIRELTTRRRARLLLSASASPLAM